MSGRAPLVARTGRLCALLGVALLATALPRAAAAQSSADVETARAYFLEGTKLGSEGRWKEARELYARSLQLKSAPITRYSLGVAQRETGRLADALASFRAFLAEPPVAGTAPYVAPARAAVTALEAKVGKVVILVEPQPVDGLALAIDGQPAPPFSERPRELDPGAHEVVARAPNFLRGSAWFNVTAGGSSTVTVTLPRAPLATVAAGLAEMMAGETPRRLDLAPVQPPPVALGAAPDRTGPAVLMGIGGGVFVVGLGVGLAGVTQAKNAATSDGADASSARTKGIAGDVLGGVGIAAAATGLVWLLAQHRPGPAPTGSVGVSLSQSGLGLRF